MLQLLLLFITTKWWATPRGESKKGWEVAALMDIIWGGINRISRFGLV